MTTDFTVDQFAKAIGVSKPTVWKHIGQGTLHAYRLGRCVRIPSSELDRIREENKLGGAS